MTSFTDVEQSPYSAKYDGGAAFPTLDVIAGERDGHGDPIESYTSAKGGMSLRDYFAAKALSNIAEMHNADAFNPTYAARAAYEFADAMIAARDRAVLAPEGGET